MPNPKPITEPGVEMYLLTEFHSCLASERVSPWNYMAPQTKTKAIWEGRGILRKPPTQAHCTGQLLTLESVDELSLPLPR